MEGNHQKLVERLMPKIVEKGEFKVVGVSCNATMMDKDMIIPKLVDEFHHSRIREIKIEVINPFHMAFLSILQILILKRTSLLGLLVLK